MTYHLLHLGCQMNKSDAERVRSVLEDLGYNATDNEEEADLLGIVACSVRQKAIDRVYARISAWNSWKDARAILTFVTGCILPTDREKLASLFDLLFDITELPRLPDLIRQHGVMTPIAATAVIPPQSLRDDEKGYWWIPARYTSTFEAYVPIQNGCDKFCTFCAVPYTRGREVSRPSEDIIAEVKGLVERGFASITLLGQNVNSYGLDRPGDEVSFAGLLRAIGEMGDSSGREFWVYFTSPHPRDMSDEVLRVIASYRCLAKQIHLPLQSGDDKVLLRMNRTYELDQYRRIVHAVREILPGATLFTDIIVGFSGETEEQFENTRRAMEEFSYNMAYIAEYSPRPGAASFRWTDDVPPAEKNRRLHVLNDQLQKGALVRHQALIGSVVRVLVSGRDRKDGYLSGRTEGRLPLRFASDDDGLIGTFVDVRVTSAAPLSLQGELAPHGEKGGQRLRGPGPAEVESTVR